jgi:hypothetical protein
MSIIIIHVGYTVLQVQNKYKLWLIQWRFQGPIVWNAIGFHVKSLSFKKFKKYLKQDFISKY